MLASVSDTLTQTSAKVFSLTILVFSFDAIEPREKKKTRKERGGTGVGGSLHHQFEIYQ